MLVVEMVKNQYRKDLEYVSCDNSHAMCSLVSNAIIADCTNLPFNNNSFDYILCIAVIHHLATYERKLQALKEIKRLLKKDCKALISVWGTQEKYGTGPKIIGWRNKTKQRFIHFFTYDEINNLCKNVFDKYKIVNDYNNFYISVFLETELDLDFGDSIFSTIIFDFFYNQLIPILHSYCRIYFS
jgi:ubiquinone/menaquinone biosynthesis C-methylase UbiE